jgi:hypothetical protein
MQNYFVYYETPDQAILNYRGQSAAVSKEFQNYKEIKELVNKLNDSKDPSERENISEEIWKLCDTGLKQVLSKDADFEINSAGQWFLKGNNIPLPSDLVEKIKEALDNNIDYSHLKEFWKHLLLNPDKNVVRQLFGFLKHNGHPITKKGYFLTYKAVAIKPEYDETTGKKVIKTKYSKDTGELQDEEINQTLTFTSIHKGPHGDIIKVGNPISMPREECDSDPDRTCSSGLNDYESEEAKTRNEELKKFEDAQKDKIAALEKELEQLKEVNNGLI